jgi:hypothetical protein
MYEQNCIRCKRKHKLLVPLRPINIRKFENNGIKQVNCKYVCSCGCSFERTFFE